MSNVTTRVWKKMFCSTWLDTLMDIISVVLDVTKEKITLKLMSEPSFATFSIATCYWIVLFPVIDLAAARKLFLVYSPYVTGSNK